MVKKRKGRSVRRNKNVHSEPTELVQAPHSFVIHRGLPGGNIVELTKDFRKVMEPFTASSLKERKKNTIKDFVSIAGLLHVSHLSIFSRTDTGMYMKLSRLPRGPTLTFKIQNFSLSRDVVSSLKKQMVVDRAFKHSPLIVLNSFSSEQVHMKMMATMFQNLFPTINLTTVDLNTIRRCVLLNYNPTTKLIDFRHYTIKVVPVGVSKGIKKVVSGKVPNLSRCADMDDFLTKSGVLSESEMEDDPNNHVTLSQKMVSRGNLEAGKSSVRLSELGPRLTLQLIKIEDGLLDGEVLYHDLIHKSEEEKLEIQHKREAKRKLKEKRKKIQDRNKKLKEEAKQEHKEKSLQGMQKNSETSSTGTKNNGEEAVLERQQEPEDDDKEYYRQELGEEPDADLFTANRGTKRRSDIHHNFKHKKMKMDTEKNQTFGDRYKGKGGEKKYPKGRDSKQHRSKSREKYPKGRDNNKQHKSKSGDKYPKAKDGNKRFNKNHPKKGRDKTNSQNRDFRPIGGKKFGVKSKNRK